PRHAEVLTDVQRVDAGQQLRLEALVGVALVAADRAALRIDLELVEGAYVVSPFEHVENADRLSGHRRQTQVPGHQLGPRGLLDALPHSVVVDFGGRTSGRLTTTATTAFALFLR